MRGRGSYVLSSLYERSTRSDRMSVQRRVGSGAVPRDDKIVIVVPSNTYAGRSRRWCAALVFMGVTMFCDEWLRR